MHYTAWCIDWDASMRVGPDPGSFLMVVNWLLLSLGLVDLKSWCCYRSNTGYPYRELAFSEVIDLFPDLSILLSSRLVFPRT